MKSRPPTSFSERSARETLTFFGQNYSSYLKNFAFLVQIECMLYFQDTLDMDSWDDHVKVCIDSKYKINYILINS